MTGERGIQLYLDERLGDYHFGEQHPFGPRRMRAFVDEVERRGLAQGCRLGKAEIASDATLASFHDADYLRRIRRQTTFGVGFLDGGDTPATTGIYAAASRVVGTALHAARYLMAGEGRAAFVPIAGLHHARRDCAAGFCVFSDIGVVIEWLKREYGLSRIAYVDIDAHHGDGVLYSFNDDPGVFIADIHQQGIYPLTGEEEEAGQGEAEGTKLNLPLDSGADDADFFAAWQRAEAFIEACEPQLVMLQCGVDSLAGDPLTSLNLSIACHAQATRALMRLAGRHCGGRLLVMGGGGYQLDNIAAGWCAVLETMRAEMPVLAGRR